MVLQLTDSAWSHGCYRRKEYKNDVLYHSYQYKDILAVFNESAGTVNASDKRAELMLKDRLITREIQNEYEQQLHRLLGCVNRLDDLSIEQIYGEIQRLRTAVLDVCVLEQEQSMRACRGCTFDPEGGLDQRTKKRELLKSCSSVIMVISQPELLSLMQSDIEDAKQMEKEIYLVVGKERGSDIPSRELLQSWLEESRRAQFLEMEDASDGFNPNGIEWNEGLQQQIDEGKAALFFYGEEGLLQCRHLKLDSIVHGIPSWYHTRVLTNQFGFSRACVIYVPSGLDVTEWVKLTKRTRLSYRQLVCLWRDHGDEIYTHSPVELYRKYPQYFLNIYESGAVCAEAAEGYPIRICWPEGTEQYSPDKLMRQFDSLRDQAVKNFLNSCDHISYYSTYFDEALNEKEIDWYCEEKQKGIMIQAVKVGKVKDASVINCEKYPTLRQMLQSEGGEREKGQLRLFSNFLFFLTPKLARLYNDIRADRPKEQISLNKMHLDYMLHEVDGRRVETFPLFKKACIAMTEDGRFLFFNYRLGGGSLRVGEFLISWSKAAVDVREGAEHTASVLVYTPYYSLPDQNGDTGSYRAVVGSGRINLVIAQDRILCVRKGSVILPSIGSVISLEDKIGEEFLRANGLIMSEDGYFDCSNLEFTIKLDGPDEVPEEVWKTVKWAYGGGQAMVMEGQNCTEDQNLLMKCLETEGWMTPLSIQTQESAYHKLVKHPRTAIGVSENGALVILVYSGRTLMSSGADYIQMTRIAKKMFPDLRYLMNVDGGGSAVLGMSMGDQFMELSCPSTSMDSCVGMARPVYTALCLEL